MHLKKRVIPLAEKLNSKITFSCDVEKKEDVVKLFEDIRSQWGEIDFVVHAVAFSDKSELSGEYLNASRENFSEKCADFHVFLSLKSAKRLQKSMKEGGSLLTLPHAVLPKQFLIITLWSVCKSALEASVKYLARDLGTKKTYRAHAISAGLY